MGQQTIALMPRTKARLDKRRMPGATYGQTIDRLVDLLEVFRELDAKKQKEILEALESKPDFMAWLFYWLHTGETDVPVK
jgi:hypothetical protein